MKFKTFTGEEIRLKRLKLGLNQTEFWSYFQTTQSGGSRYESGREVPGSIQVLLNIALGTERQANTLMTTLRGIGKDADAGRSQS